MADPVSGNISVINATSLATVTSVHTGLRATTLALDPTSGRLFVANDLGSNVTVIDSSTDIVLTTLHNLGCINSSSVCTNTIGVQYVPSLRELFVLENSAAALLRVDPSSYRLLGTAAIDPNPGGAQGYAVDSATQTIYFPSKGTDSLELIGATNGTTFARLFLGGPYGPSTTFYDPSNGFVYVMLGGIATDMGNQTVVIDPTTNNVVSLLTVGAHPNAYAADNVRHYLYIDCSNSNNISVVNDVTNEVVATIQLANGTHPVGVAVDPSTGHLFVAEEWSGQILEFAIEGPLPSHGSVPAEQDSLLGATYARWIE